MENHTEGQHLGKLLGGWMTSATILLKRGAGRYLFLFHAKLKFSSIVGPSCRSIVLTVQK